MPEQRSASEFANIALAVVFSEEVSLARMSLLLAEVEATYAVAAGVERYRWRASPARYWHDPTPQDWQYANWARLIGAFPIMAPTQNPLRLRSVEFGSPLQLLLEVPWEAYAAGGASFITALGLVLGAPHRAAAALQKGRAEYWRSRLEADEARQQYLHWRRFENRDVELVELEASPSDEVPSLEAAPPEDDLCNSDDVT
ncbi:MAG: hypothetical protein M3N47_02135 [Chloroflexota bacterium]|nr:hypothetical protein [Chloroflexota bacterium]